MGSGRGNERDRVAEGFELSNVTALLGSRIDVSLVMIDAQILVASVWIFQQVPDDHQDGAPDRNHRPGLTTTSGDAPVAGCQERVRLAGAHGCLTQDAGQVRAAVPR